MNADAYWSWREEGNVPPCIGQTEKFYIFAERAGGRTIAQLRIEQEARELCRTCIARDLCYRASFVELEGQGTRVEPGIWGGLNQQERCAASGLLPVQGTGHIACYRAARKTAARA